MTASNTPELIQAVRATRLERVSQLLAAGVDPDVRSPGGRTALHAAAEEGILDAARLLVDAGAAIDARNHAGDTPLHCAARYGRGGDIMDPDAEVRPLQFDRKLHPDVAAGWAEELIRRIPELPSTLSPTAEIPDPPGKIRVMIEALSMMGDPSWKDGFEARLRERGIDVGRIDPAFVRELFGKPECLRIAELLIERGADVNALNESGATPLYEAAGMGDLEMVDLLLDRGANPDLAGADRYPPLETAIGFRRLDVVERLHEAGAEVNPRGVDLLGLAAGLGGGGEAFTRWLLERGARLNRTDTSFAPALIIAAQTGNVETLQLLLEHGADVNARLEEDGRTALHVAASEGWADVVRMLLERGADVRALDASGRSALDVARDAEGAEDVVVMLERAAP